MFLRTARITLILLSFIVVLGAFGCSNSSSPIIPSDNETLVSTANSTTTESSDDSDWQVAEGVYNGTLTDVNGDPMAYAELYLDDEIAGWTEEDGSFEIYGVDEEAEYVLEARIDGEVLYSTTVSPSIRNGQGIGDEEPGIERGRVFGFVHDQLGPVNHAFVVVFNATENFGADFTDENGFYDIDDAPAGGCRIVAFAPEHATAKDTVFVLPGGEVQKNLFMFAKLDFGIVLGRVLTGPPMHVKPVAHATVALKSANMPNDVPPIIAHTNRFGAYAMAPVPLGPAAMKAGAICYNTELDVPVNIHPGRNFNFFHLEPAGCGGIEGQVTNEAGEPIVHAMVFVIQPPEDGSDSEPKSIWTHTGPLGFYRFAPLPPGHYGMAAKAIGYQNWHANQMTPVIPDQFTVVNIMLLAADEDPPGGDE